MEYISSVHPLDITCLDGYPRLLPPQKGQGHVHWYSLFISLLPQLIYYKRLQVLLPQYRLSHLVWRAVNTKITEKPPSLLPANKRVDSIFLLSTACLLSGWSSRKHIHLIACSLPCLGRRSSCLHEQHHTLLLQLLHFPTAHIDVCEVKKPHLYLLSETSLRHQDLDPPSGY